MCDCVTPGNGIGYQNNRMTCSNGLTAYCDPTEECFATGSFEYGRLHNGCRSPSILSRFLSNTFN